MSLAQPILTISRHPLLQRTRTLMLQQAGYSVSAARSEEEALRFLKAPKRYVLALICHSVGEASRVRLVKLMKARFPTMPVLVLYNGYAASAAHVDGSVLCLDPSPDSLMTMIRSLTTGAQGDPCTPIRYQPRPGEA
jgi:DNA-binding NtrC family response regulator